MAVRRIWFPNAPDNQSTLSDKMQLGLHVSISSDDIENFQQYDYLRRYLGDPLAIVPTGPAISETAADETDDTLYLRRYLGDPTSIV